MAVKNTDPNEEYPFIFMVSQNIQQRIPESVSEPAQYALSLVWKYYKVVDDQMVFDESRQVTCDIDEFFTKALTDYAYADDTHLSTLMAQQYSVAKIAAEVTGDTFEVVE